MNRSPGQRSTRERLLHAALEQFAERGFDGVSIASIADDLQLSKQALLHHFASKEKLYGELLARISQEFEARVNALDAGEADIASLADLLLELAAHSRAHRQQTALLMRELLDNRRRAQRVAHWYLRNFLDLLAERVLGLPLWRGASRAEAATVVYQLLGAINYFAISAPTLEAMFEDSTHRDMQRAFDPQLRSMIIHTLEAGPAGLATVDGVAAGNSKMAGSS